VKINASDASSTLKFSNLGANTTQICLVQPPSAASYTADGQLSTETNPLGGVTSFGYDPVGNQTSETDPAPDPSQPNVLPVTSDAYDPLGRVTAEIDPAGDINAYTYQFGFTDAQSNIWPGSTVTTWQGQAQAASSNAATFNSLPQGGGQQRIYDVYVQSMVPVTAYTYSITSTDGSVAAGYTSATPVLGANWYEVAMVTLNSTDSTSSLGITYSPGSGGAPTVSRIAPRKKGQAYALYYRAFPGRRLIVFFFRSIAGSCPGRRRGRCGRWIYGSSKPA